MNEFILFLRNWWFPILFALIIFLFWLLCKFVNSKLEECLFCEGSGKQGYKVSDFNELQAENCEHCQGTGKKPKKEEE